MDGGFVTCRPPHLLTQSMQEPCSLLHTEPAQAVGAEGVGERRQLAEPVDNFAKAGAVGASR